MHKRRVPTLQVACNTWRTRKIPLRKYCTRTQQQLIKEGEGGGGVGYSDLSSIRPGRANKRGKTLFLSRKKVHYELVDQNLIWTLHHILSWRFLFSFFSLNALAVLLVLAMFLCLNPVSPLINGRRGLPTADAIFLFNLKNN